MLFFTLDRCIQFQGKQAVEKCPYLRLFLKIRLCFGGKIQVEQNFYDARIANAVTG